MKIFYEGYVFNAQKVGGISRYFQNLVENLPADWEPHITLRRPPGRCFPRHPRLVTHRVPSWTDKIPRIRDAISRAYIRGFEAITACDVMHPTYYETLMYRPAFSRRIPMVITVHDMIAEIFAAEVDPDGHMAAIKRAVIEAADAILCVSESTRHDLQAYYRIPDSRIVVTHLATNLAVSAVSTGGSIPNRPYVFSVGRRGAYKNFVRLLLALAKVRPAWPELSLYVCGAPIAPAEGELIRALGLIDAIHFVGYVDDDHLAQLYHNAEALLYPSRYEGFGIPPLEAMACGTVVITSNRSSLPEVVGDAALLVNPDSVEEIAVAILQLRDLGGRRDALIQAGKARVARFSWARTTEATMAVYRSLTT